MKLLSLLLDACLVITFLFVMISLALLPATGNCQETSKSSLWLFSIYFENDFFFNTDNLYTNGLGFAGTSPSASAWKELNLLPQWSLPLVNRLPFVNGDDLDKFITISMGQKTYTPEDTGAKDPPETDRPYAGVSYTSIAFNGADDKKYTSLVVLLGIIGPHSYAADTQKTIHQTLGQGSPKGWDHQIDDELLLNLDLEHRRRWALIGNPAEPRMELLPTFGGGIGNALTFAHYGCQIRLGKDIPDDFGDDVRHPGAAKMPSDGDSEYHEQKTLGLYVFMGADLRFILWDITLNGNTYDRNDSIRKETLHYLINFGFGITYWNFRLSFSNVYSSETFETQHGMHRYGTVLFSYAY